MKRLKAFYCAMTFVQFLLPITVFSLLFFTEQDLTSDQTTIKRLETWALALFAFDLFGQLLQAIVLLVGIMKIRNIIKEKGFERMINNSAFAVHMVLFTTFVAVLLMSASVGAWAIFNDTETFNLEMLTKASGVQVLLTFVGFLLQLLLCLILWRSNKTQRGPKQQIEEKIAGR